jgi:chromosome segregation ATPase
LNAVHTAREEEVDGRETLTALQSTLSAKDEEILRLKEDLDQHLKDLTLTQEKLQKLTMAVDDVKKQKTTLEEEAEDLKTCCAVCLFTVVS